MSELSQHQVLALWRERIDDMKSDIMIDAAHRAAAVDVDFRRMLDLAEKLGQPIDLSKFAP